ncbi:MAG: iron uptake system protein EfeO [Terrabacter sp.]
MNRLHRHALTVSLAGVPLVLSGCAHDAPPSPAARSDSYPSADPTLVAEAERAYARFVADEADALLAGTTRFASAARSGDDDRARTLYPEVRTHWERIETVAESFGDLDPQLDAREADLVEGEEWTGWHRLEKDLWPARAEAYVPLTVDERTALAGQLVSDTRELVSRIRTLDLTVTDIADGSRGLLEEVASGKVTGEEEYWSRTDLHDFQANIDGAMRGFEDVRPIVEHADPDLARELDRRFSDVEDLLDQHRRGNGFVSYDQLSAEQVKDLADGVNALSEPLSLLSAVVSA